MIIKDLFNLLIQMLNYKVINKAQRIFFKKSPQPKIFINQIFTVLLKLE